jgi:hypothetical protein
MAEIGNIEIKAHERSRNRKVLLCKGEWQEKKRLTKKILANKQLNVRDKIAYKVIINYGKRREILSRLLFRTKCNW